MTENFDDILDKLFDKPEEKMQVEDNENSEQLDLFNVDYAHNGDLPVSVKQKPFASTNLLMRFRSQLNRVIWTGLNATHTKILTVILSKTADQLAAYQKEQIQKKVKELNLDKDNLDTRGAS